MIIPIPYQSKKIEIDFSLSTILYAPTQDTIRMENTRTSRQNYNCVVDELRDDFLHDLAHTKYKGKFIINSTPLYPEDTPASERLGNCFDENFAVYLKMMKKGAKFIHGEMRSRLAEWSETDDCRGMPMWHVWVEVDDMVYDCSNGKKLIMPKEMFYLRYRVAWSEDYPLTFAFESATRLTIGRPPLSENLRVLAIKEKQRQFGFIDLDHR